MNLRILKLILVFMVLLMPSILFAAKVENSFKNVSGIGYYDPGTNPDYSKMDVDDIIMYSKAAKLRYEDHSENIMRHGVKYVKSARELIRMAAHSTKVELYILDSIKRPEVVCDLRAEQAIEWVDKFWKEGCDTRRSTALYMIAERIDDLRELNILLRAVEKGEKRWIHKIYDRIKKLESNTSANHDGPPVYHSQAASWPAAPAVIELPQLDFKKMSAVEVAIYAHYCFVKHYHHYNREECLKICAREMLRASEHITSARDLFLLTYYATVLNAKCQETLLRRIAKPEVVYDLPTDMVLYKLKYYPGKNSDNTLISVVIPRIKSVDGLKAIKEYAKDVTTIIAIEARIKQLQISNIFSSKSVDKKNVNQSFDNLAGRASTVVSNSNISKNITISEANSRNLLSINESEVNTSSVQDEKSASFTDLTPASIYYGDVLIIKLKNFDKAKKVAWRVESNEGSSAPFFLPESSWPANSFKHYNTIISPLVPEPADPSILMCKIGPIPERIGIIPSNKIGQICYDPGCDDPNDFCAVQVFSRDEVADDELISESMRFEITYKAKQAAISIFGNMSDREFQNIKTVMTKLENTKGSNGKYLVEVSLERDGNPIPLNPSLKSYFYMAIINVDKCTDASAINSPSNKDNRCGNPQIITNIDEWLKAISINFKYAQLKNHKKYQIQGKNLSRYIIRGLKENSDAGVENYRKYVEFVKSMDKKGLRAFMPINKAMTEKLRVDLGMSMSLNKPKEIINLIEKYYQTSKELDAFITNNIR